MILAGSKSKTPLKQARLVQYMSSIVLHYLVAEAFCSHQEVLKRQLEKKKQDPAMMIPHLAVAPIRLANDKVNEGYLEPGKAQFFEYFALDYFTQLLIVHSYKMNVIISAHLNIDDSFEQLQVNVAKLGSKVDQLEKGFKVRCGNMVAILNQCKFANMPYLFS